MYYQDTQDHNYYSMDHYKEKVETVTIPDDLMMMMWSSVVHFGKGYKNPSYRLLVVMCPVGINPEPNQTFFMGGDASSDVWRSGAESLTKKEINDLTIVDSEVRKKYEAAKKVAERS
jgi:hypothetical protein